MYAFWWIAAALKAENAQHCPTRIQNTSCKHSIQKWALKIVQMLLNYFVYKMGSGTLPHQCQWGTENRSESWDSLSSSKTKFEDLRTQIWEEKSYCTKLRARRSSHDRVLAWCGHILVLVSYADCATSHGIKVIPNGFKYGLLVLILVGSRRRPSSV